MFRKHRFICFLLAALLVFTLAACGKGNDTSKPSGSAQASDQGQPAASGGAQLDPVDDSESKPSGSQTPEAAKLTGALNLIQLDDRDPSILRGLRIIGSRAGSAEGMNARPSSLTDVRCIFELNEWIEFYPDTDAEFYMRVWILQHREDQESYNTCRFSDLMPGFVSYCDLHYPVDAEDPENWCWGNFYLNAEEWEPGLYDFVITYEGKAIATLLTRFYPVDELSSKSDAELEALMHE